MNKDKYYYILEKDLSYIFEQIQDNICRDDFNEIKEYIDVGEYGLAFETMCEIISEERIRISKPTFQRIEHAGRMMRFDHALWLSVLVRNEHEGWH